MSKKRYEGFTNMSNKITFREYDQIYVFDVNTRLHAPCFNVILCSYIMAKMLMS